MSRLYQNGAEMQSTLELASADGLVTSTTQKRISGASWVISGSLPTDDILGADLAAPPIAGGTNLYGCIWLYFDSIPETATDLSDEILFYLDLMNGSGVQIAAINIHNVTGDGLTVRTYYNDFALSGTPSTTGMAMDTWFKLSWHFDSTPANGSEIFEVKINDVSVILDNTINFTTKTVSTWDIGVYNGSGGTITTEVIYIDDIILNNSAGLINNGYPGDDHIVVALPTGAGDSAAQAGTFASINEIPATNTATGAGDRIELDNNGSIGEYAITDSATLGLDSFNQISAIQVMCLIREEAATTTSYTHRIKSASGGSTTSGTASDAGNATVRVSPNGTTAFGRMLISEIDPTTGIAWTPTGTNSLDNAQIGIGSASANDIWVTWLGAMVAYNTGTPPGIAKVSTFTENFDSAIIDAGTWFDWGNITTPGSIYQSSGKIVLNTLPGANNYHGMNTITSYDLTDSSVSSEMISAGNQTITSFEAYPMFFIVDQDNAVAFLVTGGIIYFYKRVATVPDTTNSVTYDPDVHRWFRLREAAGTLFWETSKDRINWTTGHSEATPLDVTDGDIEIMVGTWQAEANLGTMIIDNINTAGNDRHNSMLSLGVG